MWVALVVGLLFLAGAAYNIFGPEPNLAEALVGTAIAAVLIGLFFFLQSARGRDAEFLEWLTNNAGAIEQGGARYRDVLITPATVLTRYQAALSFLIVTFKVPSRLYVVDHDATEAVAVAYTAISVLLGWWGLPRGPVYTAQSISTNLQGGAKLKVVDLLHPKPASPIPEQDPTATADVPTLREGLRSPDPAVRERSLSALGDRGSSAVGALPDIELLLNDPVRVVRARAKWAIENIRRKARQ